MDRVDRTADGGLSVIDYKAGRPASYRGLVDGDPVAAGTRLQLPLYALAAEGRFGATGPSRSGYVFIDENAPENPVGYVVDEARRARFDDVTGVLADGIAAGAFPARPGTYEPFMVRFENCAYCDYDRCCPADRDQQWESVVDAPELAAYVALVEGDEDDEAPA
jgi:hypothetical protein